MGNNPVVFVDPSGGYMKLYSRSNFVNDMMRLWEEWRESARDVWERWDNFKYNVGFPSGASGGASRGNNSTSYGIDASGQPVDFTQQIKDVINETNGTTAWNLNHAAMTDRSGTTPYVSNTTASSATGIYSAGGKTIIKTQRLIVTPNDELTLIGSKSTIYNTPDGVMIDLGTESYWALPYNSGYNASDFGDDGWNAQGSGGGLSSPRDFANELKYYYKYNSGTDYHLSPERFNDVYNQAHQNNAIQWNKAKLLPNSNYNIPVNFYKTPYKWAFGSASMQFSFDKTNGFQPVGFYDYWDLDSKPWFGEGSRSFGAEIITRYYNWQLNGTGFNVKFP